MTANRDLRDERSLMLYDAQRKSLIIAYLLWFFLGQFGVHRMYLNHWASGIFMLILAGISWALTLILIGYIGLAILGLWWLIDGLLTYFMVNGHNTQLAYRLSR
jgi:TM2 domain-containing membrane protein YozV